MEHSHYKYHLEMMLAALSNRKEDLKSPLYLDTRVYLSLDRVELKIVERLLKRDLETVEAVLENKD
jgi:hypothetical protein